MKVIPSGEQVTPWLRQFARKCGLVLARAHATTGDAAAIDAYLGKGRAFDAAMVELRSGLRRAEPATTTPNSSTPSATARSTAHQAGDIHREHPLRQVGATCADLRTVRSHFTTGRRGTAGAGASPTVIGMTPEEIADLAHLRRARDLIDRDYAKPLDVPAMARAALDVAGALLAQVPRRVRRDAVLLPHDPPHRAGEGAAASGDVGHRRLRRRRLHVARLVQLALHRDRRRDALAVPRTRPPPPRGRPVVRDQGRHATAAHRPSSPPDRGTEQDRRSTRRAAVRTVVA